MNHLFYGDNLRVLRDFVRDGSVDLIYQDLPLSVKAKMVGKGHE